MKFFISILLITSCLISCRTERNFTYFKDISDTASYVSFADTGYKQLVIKPDDIIVVNISSPNPEATSFFLTQGTSSTASSGVSAPGAATPNTYLVDKEGGIDLPLVGRVMVKGLTTAMAKTEIKNKVSTYLKDAIVTVRLQNFKVTILGEVNHPANYIVPNERVSLLDAIGMAGDLTIYGRRENILLIREQDGKKTLTRMDLNSSKIFQSPYYYLQQNDIIYVEPNKQKAASSDITTIRNLTIITSFASLATIIVSQLLRR